VRVFKGKWFNHYAAKYTISDEVLLKASQEIEQGLVDANLGGNVYKKRIGKNGKGRRGGYRTIVLFRSGERLFFQFGYAKNVLDTIDTKEEKEYKDLADWYFALTDEQLDAMVKTGRLFEIKEGANVEVSQRSSKG
jgi:hypothetical protein